MDIEYQVSDVREFAQDNGATDIDVGYESFGDYTKAFLEVEFTQFPDMSQFKDAENIEVDEEWGEDRVMFEVILNTR